MIDTHCEAKTRRGTRWDNAELTSSCSGSPEGVIHMLFDRLCRQSPEKAQDLLQDLNILLKEQQQ